MTQHEPPPDNDGWLVWAFVAVGVYAIGYLVGLAFGWWAP